MNVVKIAEIMKCDITYGNFAGLHMILLPGFVV